MLIDKFTQLNNKTKILIAVGLQVMVFFIIIALKSFTIVTGTEVTLLVEPVDPYDIFRGEYVHLRYDISRIDLSKVRNEGILKGNVKSTDTNDSEFPTNSPYNEETNDRTAEPLNMSKYETYEEPTEKPALTKPKTVYVTLQKSKANEYFEPILVSVNKPGSGIFIKGNVQYYESENPNNKPTILNMTYGIEDYYVEEGKGREIESEINKHQILAKVKVDSSGNSVLTDLVTTAKPVVTPTPRPTLKVTPYPTPIVNKEITDCVLYSQDKKVLLKNKPNIVINSCNKDDATLEAKKLYITFYTSSSNPFSKSYETQTKKLVENKDVLAYLDDRNGNTHQNILGIVKETNLIFQIVKNDPVDNELSFSATDLAEAKDILNNLSVEPNELNLQETSPITNPFNGTANFQAQLNNGVCNINLDNKAKMQVKGNSVYYINNCSNDQVKFINNAKTIFVDFYEHNNEPKVPFSDIPEKNKEQFYYENKQIGAYLINLAEGQTVYAPIYTKNINEQDPTMKYYLQFTLDTKQSNSTNFSTKELAEIKTFLDSIIINP